MSFIERILCKVFPYVDILRDDTKDIYLRRWFIYPRNKDFKKQEPRLYLHKFYRGDEDPHCHDHPWKFTSLLLTGGYWEETPCYQPRDRNVPLSSLKDEKYDYYRRDGIEYRKYFYPRWSLLKRPAEWRHRVVLDGTKPVWTLVKTGVKERSWGFWIKNKLCPWRRYNDGVCWCDEGQSEQAKAKGSEVFD